MISAMDFRSTVTLHTGTSMPVLGLGTWQLNKDTAGTIETALKLGYRMIDTSGDYGTQPGIGEGIKRSGINRSDLYLVTKVEEDDDAYEATKKNLKELQLQYANLMLIHRPPKNSAGIELWQGLIRARQEGLTRDIGVSNYPVEKIDELILATEEAPVVNQIEWSPFGHSDAMQSYCDRSGIVIQAYSPLTRTQKLKDKILGRIAKKYGKSPAQVIIRWNLQKGVVPLPKANKNQHLKEDIDVFDFELGEEDFELLDGLNEHYSSLGKLPYD